MFEAVLAGFIGGVIAAGCAGLAQALWLKAFGLTVRQRKAKKLASSSRLDFSREAADRAREAQTRQSASS